MRSATIGLLAATILLTSCSSAEDEAAAKACSLFENSVNGFLVLAEKGAGFDPATVRGALTEAGSNLQDAVNAAPASLASKMRDGEKLVQLYAQSTAIGRSTDDVGTLMFANFKDVKKACGEAGAPIKYPPSFND